MAMVIPMARPRLSSSFHTQASTPRQVLRLASYKTVKRILCCSLTSTDAPSRQLLMHGEFDAYIMDSCSRCRNGTDIASVLASIPLSHLSTCSPGHASTLLSTMTRLQAVNAAPPGTMYHVLQSLIVTALETEGEALTVSFTSTARAIHSLSLIRGSQEIRNLFSNSSVPRALMDAIDALPRRRDGQSSQHLDDLGLLLSAFARCNLNINKGEFSDLISNAVLVRLGSANASSLLSLAAIISSTSSSPTFSLYHLLPALIQTALLTSASELSLPPENMPQPIGSALVSLLAAAVRSKRALPGLFRRLLALLSWHCAKSTHECPALHPRDLSMALWALSRLQYKKVHPIRPSRAVVPDQALSPNLSTSPPPQKISQPLWGSLNKARRMVLGRGRRGKRLDPEIFLLRDAGSEWPEWNDALSSLCSNVRVISQGADSSWDGYSITRSLMSLSKIGAASRKDRIWLTLSAKSLRAFHDSQTEGKKKRMPLGSKRFPLGEQQRRGAMRKNVAEAALSLLPIAVRFNSYDVWCLTTLFRSFAGLVYLERMTSGEQPPLSHPYTHLPFLTAQLHRRILAGGLKALKSTALCQQPPAVVLGTRQLVIVASSVMMLQRKTTRRWAASFARAVEASLINGPVSMTASGCLSLLHCCQGQLDPDLASKLVRSIHQDVTGRKYLWPRQVLRLIQAATDHNMLHLPGILTIIIELARPMIPKFSKSGGSLPFVIEHLCLSSEPCAVLVKSAKRRRILFESIIDSIRRASRIDQLLILARGVTLHLDPGGPSSVEERELLADVSIEMKAKALSLRQMMRERRWSGWRKADEDVALIGIESNRWHLGPPL